jgi:hypothetical protein
LRCYQLLFGSALGAQAVVAAGAALASAARGSSSAVLLLARPSAGERHGVGEDGTAVVGVQAALCLTRGTADARSAARGWEKRLAGARLCVVLDRDWAVALHSAQGSGDDGGDVAGQGSGDVRPYPAAHVGSRIHHHKWRPQSCVPLHTALIRAALEALTAGESEKCAYAYTGGPGTFVPQQYQGLQVGPLPRGQYTVSAWVQERQPPNCVGGKDRGQRCVQEPGSVGLRALSLPAERGVVVG